MGFAQIIRDGVALADSMTSQVDGLQDDIQIFPWIGDDDFSRPKYGDPIVTSAIIEDKQMERKLSGGHEVVQHSEITILHPIAPNGAPNRHEPVDTRDKIVLSDGYTGPILSIDGPKDPKTNAPYLFTILLG